MRLFKIISIALTISLKTADSTNKCKLFFDNENYSWWSSDREFYKRFASQYSDAEVARYQDGLLYVNGYPVYDNFGNYYECLSPGHLLGRFIWDLQEDQAEVTPCVPTYRIRMLMLSPHSTLPLDAENRLTGTTVVHNTTVKKTLWKYEKDNIKTFSEIFHVYDEPITCNNDSNSKEFVVLDGKYIAENVFTDYLAEKPEMLKFFLIVIVNDAPACLKIRVDYTKELWNGTHEDICYHCPRMYHTSYAALYPDYDRIEQAESSAPPWVDDELSARGSVWCRSHRAIMAVTDVLWFIACRPGSRQVAERGAVTGPARCSLLVRGDRRHIIMHFDQFRYLLTVKARVVSKCHWRIDALELKYKTRKKGGSLLISKYEGRAVRSKKTLYWLNASSELIVARGCGPHLHLGIIAVEYNDDGVGYNFSSKLY